MIERITASTNRSIKKWRMLAKRAEVSEQETVFLAEGEHMAGEALSSGYSTELIVSFSGSEKYSKWICFAEEHGIRVYLIPDQIFCSITDTKTPQGIFSVCSVPTCKCDPYSFRKTVALEGVQDPGNVGTIMRTMDAAGFDAIVVDNHCANPFSPKALRASMGAVFRIPVFRSENIPRTLSEMKEHGIRVIAGDLRGKPMYQVDFSLGSYCILIGNEGSGISDASRSIADLPVKIPMPGKAESMNAAVAAAILIYETVRGEYA